MRRNNMIKHYLLKVEIINGEIEMGEQLLFTTEEANKETAAHNAIRYNWGVDDDNQDEITGEGGYWYNDMILSIGDIIELPEEDYKVLKKYEHEAVL